MMFLFYSVRRKSQHLPPSLLVAYSVPVQNINFLPPPSCVTPPGPKYIVVATVVRVQHLYSNRYYSLAYVIVVAAVQWFSGWYWADVRLLSKF
ncbi:hypothetical protein M8J75_001684 [Diaphorina citri]|nr:hypothetical protein M8J75_001684 [Diaphorina citri]KAI5715052.1 hypothetical protein M8J77_009768 [Diaphorina citri]